MPGAVAVILLMIVAFAAQFDHSTAETKLRPDAVVLARSTEAGVAAQAAVPASRP